MIITESWIIVFVKIKTPFFWQIREMFRYLVTYSSLCDKLPIEPGTIVVNTSLSSIKDFLYHILNTVFCRKVSQYTWGKRLYKNIHHNTFKFSWHKFINCDYEKHTLNLYFSITKKIHFCILVLWSDCLFRKIGNCSRTFLIFDFVGCWFIRG